MVWSFFLVLAVACILDLYMKLPLSRHRPPRPPGGSVV